MCLYYAIYREEVKIWHQLSFKENSGFKYRPQNLEIINIILPAASYRCESWALDKAIGDHVSAFEVK